MNWEHIAIIALTAFAGYLHGRLEGFRSIVRVYMNHKDEATP